jgi:hypothetical protein
MVAAMSVRAQVHAGDTWMGDDDGKFVHIEMVFEPPKCGASRHIWWVAEEGREGNVAAETEFVSRHTLVRRRALSDT